jgi:capsular polysaccharide export protein
MSIGAESAPLAPLYVKGFSWRKRCLLARFMPHRQLRLVRGARGIERLPPNAELAVWGSMPVSASRSDLHLIRVEDGFLRSIGLGADLVAPLSWVFDTRGIYYDPARPSRLEEILQEGNFTDELLQRAAQLRSRIVATGLTKYNVGYSGWHRPLTARPVVLVVGQVERDASMQASGFGPGANMALLSAVRASRPEAWVAYKPHPDVLAGLRKAGRGESEAAAYCNEVLGDISINSVLAAVDEVHVSTSLTGFEALLRGKQVTTHGQPFYAGWGLTTDLAPVARRTRKLSLDALVAGALLLYPRYLSCDGRKQLQPEEALEELIEWRQRTQSRANPAVSLVQKSLRVLSRLAIAR